MGPEHLSRPLQSDRLETSHQLTRQSRLLQPMRNVPAICRVPVENQRRMPLRLEDSARLTRLGWREWRGVGCRSRIWPTTGGRDLEETRIGRGGRWTHDDKAQAISREGDRAAETNAARPS